MVWSENKIQYYMCIQLAYMIIILKKTQQICKKKMITYIQKLVHILVNLVIVGYATQCIVFNNVKPCLQNISG